MSPAMDAAEKRNAELLRGAIRAHQAGHLLAARALYERVLKRRPRDPDALHFFGVLRHNLGDTADGIVLLGRSLEVAPGNPHAWLNLGNMLLESERTLEAQAAYERVAALSPDMADAWYNLGICLRKMANPAAAIEALDRALVLRPSHAQSHYQRGIAHREAGGQADAERDFRRTLELQPGFLDVYESLAMLLYRQKRIEEAALVYAAWLERDPDDSTAAHMFAATSGIAAPSRGSDAYIAETFDRFASTFDENLANLEYRAPVLVAQALAECLPQGMLLESLLDAGCGTGLCGELLGPYARRLVGVDLSPAMVDIARRKGRYDELYVAELCAFMRDRSAAFDAIIAADTVVYFGDLKEVLTSAAGCLKESGLLVMTLEQCLDGLQDWRLEPHGRYVHRLDYVGTILQRTGFRVVSVAERALRKERGEPVAGLVFCAVRVPRAG